MYFFSYNILHETAMRKVEVIIWQIYIFKSVKAYEQIVANIIRFSSFLEVVQMHLHIDVYALLDIIVE